MQLKALIEGAKGNQIMQTSTVFILKMHGHSVAGGDVLSYRFSPVLNWLDLAIYSKKTFLVYSIKQPVTIR
jgi:hypothetical protein